MDLMDGWSTSKSQNTTHEYWGKEFDAVTIKGLFSSDYNQFRKPLNKLYRHHYYYDGYGYYC